MTIWNPLSSVAKSKTMLRMAGVTIATLGILTSSTVALAEESSPANGYPAPNYAANGYPEVPPQLKGTSVKCETPSKCAPGNQFIKAFKNNDRLEAGPNFPGTSIPKYRGFLYPKNWGYPSYVYFGNKYYGESSDPEKNKLANFISDDDYLYRHRDFVVPEYQEDVGEGVPADINVPDINGSQNIYMSIQGFHQKSIPGEDGKYINWVVAFTAKTRNVNNRYVVQFGLSEGQSIKFSSGSSLVNGYNTPDNWDKSALDLYTEVPSYDRTSAGIGYRNYHNLYWSKTIFANNNYYVYLDRTNDYMYKPDHLVFLRIRTKITDPTLPDFALRARITTFDYSLGLNDASNYSNFAYPNSLHGYEGKNLWCVTQPALDKAPWDNARVAPQCKDDDSSQWLYAGSHTYATGDNRLNYGRKSHKTVTGQASVSNIKTNARGNNGENEFNNYSLPNPLTYEENATLQLPNSTSLQGDFVASTPNPELAELSSIPLIQDYYLAAGKDGQAQDYRQVNSPYLINVNKTADSIPINFSEEQRANRENTLEYPDSYLSLRATSAAQSDDQAKSECNQAGISNCDEATAHPETRRDPAALRDHLSSHAAGDGGSGEYFVDLVMQGKDYLRAKAGYNYVYLLDRSGSMRRNLVNCTGNGCAKIDILKKAMTAALRKIEQTNVELAASNAKLSKVAIIDFADTPWMWNGGSNPARAAVTNRETVFGTNIDEAIAYLDSVVKVAKYRGGATNYQGALMLLDKVLSTLDEDELRHTKVIFLTDGMPTASYKLERLFGTKDGKVSPLTTFEYRGDFVLGKTLVRSTETGFPISSLGYRAKLDEVLGLKPGVSNLCMDGVIPYGEDEKLLEEKLSNGVYVKIDNSVFDMNSGFKTVVQPDGTVRSVPITEQEIGRYYQGENVMYKNTYLGRQYDNRSNIWMPCWIYDPRENWMLEDRPHMEPWDLMRCRSDERLQNRAYTPTLSPYYRYSGYLNPDRANTVENAGYIDLTSQKDPRVWNTGQIINYFSPSTVRNNGTPTKAHILQLRDAYSWEARKNGTGPVLLDRGLVPQREGVEFYAGEIIGEDMDEEEQTIAKNVLEYFVNGKNSDEKSRYLHILSNDNFENIFYDSLYPDLFNKTVQKAKLVNPVGSNVQLLNHTGEAISGEISTPELKLAGTPLLEDGEIFLNAKLDNVSYRFTNNVTKEELENIIPAPLRGFVPRDLVKDSELKDLTLDELTALLTSKINALEPSKFKGMLQHLAESLDIGQLSSLFGLQYDPQQTVAAQRTRIESLISALNTDSSQAATEYKRVVNRVAARLTHRFMIYRLKNLLNLRFETDESGRSVLKADDVNLGAYEWIHMRYRVKLDKSKNAVSEGRFNLLTGTDSRLENPGPTGALDSLDLAQRGHATAWRTEGDDGSEETYAVDPAKLRSRAFPTPSGRVKPDVKLGRVLIRKQGYTLGDTQNLSPLTGSEFKLEEVGAEGTSVALQTMKCAQGQAAQEPLSCANTDTSEGYFLSAEIKLGTKYRLTEIKAPSGHQLLAEPIYFELTSPTAENPGGTVELAPQSRSELVQVDTANVKLATAEPTVLPRLIVSDVERGHLPASGGRGVVLSLFFGGSVLWAGAWALRRRRFA